jgi:hypothetical protein
MVISSELCSAKSGSGHLYVDGAVGLGGGLHWPLTPEVAGVRANGCHDREGPLLPSQILTPAPVTLEPPAVSTVLLFQLLLLGFFVVSYLGVVCANSVDLHRATGFSSPTKVVLMLAMSMPRPRSC